MQLVLRYLGLALEIWRYRLLVVARARSWIADLLPTASLSTLDFVADDASKTLFEILGAHRDFRVVEFTLGKRMHLVH